jgi:two-component system OmpR family sensor kinase
MIRRWLWAGVLIYLIALILAAIAVGAQRQYVRLALPASDALFVVGLAAGGVIVGLSVISGLVRERRQARAEQQRLEALAAQQAVTVRAHESTIEMQVRAIQEHQTFRRALNHELRNPLTAISVGIDNLGDECAADTVAQLKSDVERISTLLETVSALSRLETSPIELVPVRVDQLIEQVIDMLQAGPAAQHCRLIVNLPAAPFPLPPVLGDEDLLFIVLHNLLNNAIKFTPDDGEVTVRGLQDEGYAVIQISDNGLGMSAEDVQAAGQPFQRGQTALEHQIPGSGLGLYQAYKIVARLHGKIVLHSEPGKGTVVTIHLPIAPPARTG